MAASKGFSLGGLKIGPREKTWAVLCATIALWTTGYRTAVSPRIDAARQSKANVQRMENELLRLEAKRPDTEARRASMEQVKTQVASTYEQLEILEQGLLNRQDLDLLLERVVAHHKRLELQVNAVRPMKDDAEKSKDQDRQPSESTFYKRLLVQLDIYAAFDNLIAYLNALEHQAPYQRVRALLVKIEGQDMVRPRALVWLQALLADAPESVAQRRQEVFALVEQAAKRDAKDPFLALEKPKEEQLAVGLELNGVFGADGNLSALINGESYQVGDVIQGKRIVAIHSDRVVLEQGARRFLLHGGSASE
jgi:Tfp pilus assembly protein PilO